jgi:hypothetical protein
MRDEYDLRNGRPNPYIAKLGPKGRADLVKWWASVNDNIRVLPPDVAEEFPDTKSTVDALRLVMKLRAVKPTTRRKARSA